MRGQQNINISTLLTAIHEFMFVIWVLINRRELKSVWKITTRYP